MFARTRRYKWNYFLLSREKWNSWDVNTNGWRLESSPYTSSEMSLIFPHTFYFLELIFLPQICFSTATIGTCNPLFLNLWYFFVRRNSFACENIVVGVPKLNRSELETACEDFSNIITSGNSYIVYKGTLSSGVEIAVISTTISSLQDWSVHSETAFRKKVNHFFAYTN